MKKTLLILAVMLMGLGAMAQSTYTKVTSESELNAGDKVLLVGIDDNGQAWAMSYQKPNNRKALAVTMNDNAIVTTVATDPSSQTEPYEITIGGQAGAWPFFDELNNGFMLPVAAITSRLRLPTTIKESGPCHWMAKVSFLRQMAVSNKTLCVTTPIRKTMILCLDATSPRQV